MLRPHRSCALILFAVVAGWTVEDPDLVESISCSVGSLVLGWAGLAYFRQRLVADAVGVHVRNLATSFTVPWSAIDHFEPPAATGRRTGLRIVQHDGEVRCAALWAPNRVNRRDFARPTVDALNELLAAR